VSFEKWVAISISFDTGLLPIHHRFSFCKTQKNTRYTISTFQTL